MTRLTYWGRLVPDFRRREATILIITLWVVTILSAITLSLTYRMSMELKMAGSELEREKALCIAKAGVVRAIAVLGEDSGAADFLNEQWNDYNEEFYGVNLFRNISVGEGTFTISYVYGKDMFTGENNIFYGMEDEERKINVNKAKQDVLQSVQGMNPEIALSIRAWRGDADITTDITIKEDTYYQGLEKPYKRKGKEIQSLEELILIRGITPELLYGKDLDADGQIGINEKGIIKYLTVYGDGLININTADIMVLRVFFPGDLTDRIMRYRLGPDGMLGTNDDRFFEEVGKIAERLNEEEPLTPDEQELIKKNQSLFKVSSKYYKANIEANIPNSVKKEVSVIIDKEAAEGEKVVRWDE